MGIIYEKEKHLYILNATSNLLYVVLLLIKNHL